MDKVQERNEQDANRLLAAADAISQTFDWQFSVQGHEYWKTVVGNLVVMALELRRGDDGNNDD